MLPDTAASKVTAAHLSRQAVLYIEQAVQPRAGVIHNTESAIRSTTCAARRSRWAGRGGRPDHRNRHRPGPLRRLRPARPGGVRADW